MKKRILMMALSLSLVGALLVGCGSQATSSSTGSASSASSASTDSSVDSDDALAEETASESFSVEVDLSIVAFDNDDLYVEIIGANVSDAASCNILLYIENKSSDDYSISLDETLLNRVETQGGSTLTTVAAGESVTAYQEFNTNAMQIFLAHGLSEITQMELDVKAYNKTTSEKEISTVSVYPYGEEAATAFRWELQEGEQIIYEDDMVQIIIYNFSDDESNIIGSYGVHYYIYNKLDDQLRMELKVVSANGIELNTTAAAARTEFISTMMTLQNDRGVFIEEYRKTEACERYDFTTDTVTTFDLEIGLYQDEDAYLLGHAYYKGVVTVNP